MFSVENVEHRIPNIIPSRDLGTDTYLRFWKHSVPMRVYPRQRLNIKFWHVPWIQRVPFGNGPAFMELWYLRALDRKHVPCSGDALKTTWWNKFSEIFSCLAIHAWSDCSLLSHVCSAKRVFSKCTELEERINELYIKRYGYLSTRCTVPLYIQGVP